MKRDGLSALMTCIRAAALWALWAGLAHMQTAPAEAALVKSIPAYDGTADYPLPARLSQTGLYDNAASKQRTVTSGIARYEINNPLWSDGAAKERFIALPSGAKVTPTDTAGYKFPDKTVLIKNFMMDTVYGDSGSRILIETRFLVIRMQGASATYHGLTYKWRRDQADAELVSNAGLDTVLTLKMGGKIRGKRWSYPSQTQCRSCHFGRGVLGFITPQLNRMIAPPGGGTAINQLQTLAAAGILASNPVAGKPNALRWVGMLEAGDFTLEQRARSYFASNCSHCHGNGNAPEGAEHDFDYFRSGIKITADTLGGYVGKESSKSALFPKVIYPGFPESSLVIMRMLARRDGWEMPPLASYQVDSSAVKVIKDWICSLGSRGTACKLPTVNPDDAYWEDAPAGAFPHALHRPRAPDQLTVNGSILTVMPGLRGRVALLDWRGREIRLIPMGNRDFRMAAPLGTGVYFLKAGSRVIRFSHLP